VVVLFIFLVFQKLPKNMTQHGGAVFICGSFSSRSANYSWLGI